MAKIRLIMRIFAPIDRDESYLQTTIIEVPADIAKNACWIIGAELIPDQGVTNGQ